MQEYKVSQYNFTFPYSRKSASGKDQKVLYNNRTGAIALIEEDKYEQYLAFCEKGEAVQDEELFEDMKRGGYVVESQFDECAALKYKLFASRYDNSALSLTIAPTSDCNFRCIYCYEKDSIRPVTMSEQTQQELIDFVKQYLPTIKHLAISWYGGEPLLAIDIIEKLTGTFLELCQENKVEYIASMVTNGYLLTPENVEKLHKLKVESIQVTLDGAAEDHDKRRFLKGGHPTFDQIIENLRASRDNLPERVSIRINADRRNIDRVDNVIQILKENGLDGKVEPYLAMVVNSNNAYNDNSCLHTNDFSRYVFDFANRNGMDFLHFIPQQISSFCGADRLLSFVVNADGSLFKCWDDMGIASCSVGSLKDGPKNCKRLNDYMLYDATEDPKCRDCKFLPTCMGACPHARVQNTQESCEGMLQSLENYMSVIPEILEQQVDAAKQAKEA